MLALIAVSLAGGIVLGQLTSSATVSNTGTVKSVGVGIYSDIDCLNSVNSIDWGVIEPGEQIVKSIYIRNDGNADVQLYLTVENWVPATAANYVTLTWDCEGQTLTPNQVKHANLTLSISSSAESITGFAFDMVISGMG